MTNKYQPTSNNRLAGSTQYSFGKAGMLAVLAVVATLAAGCTSSEFTWGEGPQLELAVPSPLAEVEPMIVTRRFKTTFGPYTARKQRGSLRRWTIPMGDLSFNTDSFRHWFQFSEETGGESPTERVVQCVGDDRYTRLGGLTMRRESEEGEVLLACAEMDADDEVPLWRLVIENRYKAEAGYVELGERNWELVRGEPVTPMPYDDDLGFLVFDGDRAVAAVEIAGRGRVWIDPGLSGVERHAAAAVAATAITFEHRRQN